MAALLGSTPDSHGMTSQDFQDNMKKMADLFNNVSSSSPDAHVPAPNSVYIKVPARRASTHDAAASTSTPPP